MWKQLLYTGLSLGIVLGATACDTDIDPDDREQSIGYRTGTAEDGFTSNGERGNTLITEINWAGSVNDEGVYDPTDIFIEFQNKNSRPVYLTGWQLIIRAGTGRPGEDHRYARHERPNFTFVIPERENGGPVYPNEFVVLTTRREGGAVANPDFIIEDLRIPYDRWSVTLRDLDDRLITNGGSIDQESFAGGYDGVTVRSMERTQILFANQGGRNSSWHTYAYNPWDEDHAERRSRVSEGFKEHTYASPGRANSPDYSGNTASGDFQ